MALYKKLLRKEERLSLIGLGYVGMPIAVAFANKGVSVIGFDLNKAKIDLYRSGIDPTKEVGDDVIAQTSVEFTANEKKLQEAKFHIVAVPTPVNTDHTPDLAPVIGASQIIGRNLTKGSIVVYESAVYPGVTEDVCVPILEKESGMKCGVDFKVGYSPERINPGDKVHRLENIKKIDTNEVVDGMNTKWNALGFRPGLVGGHCIGVDPYYFTYEAEKLGYHSQIILNGRIVNNGMGKFVADTAVKQMIDAGMAPKKAKVVILGLTFKENCPDTRNSNVDDIIKTLNTYGIEPVVVDPWTNQRDAMHEYGVTLTDLKDVKDADYIIVAVAHKEFRTISLEDIKALYRQCPDQEKVLLDVKGIYSVKELNASNMKYWRL